MQFLAAVFRFFTNIGAVFRFCRLLRFAEIDVFLTRFSVLPYISSGFSVFENYAVGGYSLPYYGSRFAGITINEARANEQYTIDIFLYVRSISFNIRLFGGFLRWEKLPSLLPFVHSK